MEKSWYHSKTIWFNLFAAALGTAEQLSGLGILGPQTTAIIGAVVPVGNILLRTITSIPLGK